MNYLTVVACTFSVNSQNCSWLQFWYFVRLFWFCTLYKGTQHGFLCIGFWDILYLIVTEKVRYLELFAKLVDLLRTHVEGVKGTSCSLAPARELGVILAVAPCSKWCLAMQRARQQPGTSRFPLVLEGKRVPATLSGAGTVLLQRCQCTLGLSVCQPSGTLVLSRNNKLGATSVLVRTNCGSNNRALLTCYVSDMQVHRKVHK